MSDSPHPAFDNEIPLPSDKDCLGYVDVDDGLTRDPKGLAKTPEDTAFSHLTSARTDLYLATDAIEDDKERGLVHRCLAALDRMRWAIRRRKL